MDYSKTSPCKNCPYRKDAPLALWDKEEFIKLLAHDKLQFGKVYNCHKKDDSVCRGFLMNQFERDIPNIDVRMSLMLHKVSYQFLDTLSCESPMFNTIEEMAEANYPGILRYIFFKNLSDAVAQEDEGVGVGSEAQDNA